MNIKKLFTDKDAVSPVIGVILMVAITVILAAVIGTFVLGLGDQVQDTAPQASFGFDFTAKDSTGDANDDVLTVTHEGGDELTASNVELSVSGIQYEDGSSLSGSGSYTAGTSWSSTPISAGSSLTVEDETDYVDSSGTAVTAASKGTDLNSATARIVWTSSGGGNSATLAKWDGPDA